VKASDAIHAHLRDAILAGTLGPGDPVPSERELAARFGVHRHAVREAVKRLQQARLVEVSQGGPTRVLDWRANGGLELLLDLDVVADPHLVRAVVELRAAIGVDAARRCAERGSAEVRDHAARLAETAANNIDTMRRMMFAMLWDVIVDGADNLAYRLGLNTLVARLGEHPELELALLPGDEDDQNLRALAQALRDGDGEAAAAATRPLLERPLAAL